MSPINPIVLQRRHAELGRIRLGDKGTKGQPQKLTRFRITSPSERHIRALAELYGGEAKPWKNSGRDEWEVYTEAQSIPVIVVRGGITQWMETWSGGGCVHRCDGVTNVLTDEACDPDDPNHANAKPTTRLSVMLRELDAIGVFRLESHGWNSAAELPGLVELAQHVGELVPANLYLAERLSVAGGQTKRFIVPGLDLGVTPGRLAEIVSGKATQQVEARADESRRISAPPNHAITAYGIELRDATTIEACQTVWHKAGQAGHLDDDLKRAINARAAEITEAAGAPAAPSTAGYDPDIDAAQLQAQLDHLRAQPVPS